MSASALNLKVCGASDKHMGAPTGAAGARFRSLRSHNSLGGPTNAFGSVLKPMGPLINPGSANECSWGQVSKSVEPLINAWELLRLHLGSALNLWGL